MFKYTASPEVLRKFKSIRKNSKKPWNDEFHFAVYIIGSSDAYFRSGGFWKNYLPLVFYSPTRRKTVPVNGILINVEWFVETEEILT